MPLIICTLFFVVLFACEGIWFLTLRAQNEDDLLRYQRIEHPRRMTEDRYIDLFS